jgi:hypothetical protein
MCVTATQTADFRLSFEPARHWSPLGNVIADLAPNGSAPRLAYLSVSFGHLPQRQAPWAARFWEDDPPPGAKPVEWLLGSTGAVTCMEQALELLDGTRGLVTSYAVT